MCNRPLNSTLIVWRCIFPEQFSSLLRNPKLSAIVTHRLLLFKPWIIDVTAATMTLAGNASKLHFWRCGTTAEVCLSRVVSWLSSPSSNAACIRITGTDTRVSTARSSSYSSFLEPWVSYCLSSSTQTIFTRAFRSTSGIQFPEVVKKDHHHILAEDSLETLTGIVLTTPFPCDREFYSTLDVACRSRLDWQKNGRNF